MSFAVFMVKVHYYYRSFAASTLMRSAPSIKIGAMDFDLSKPQKLLKDSARALLSLRHKSLPRGMKVRRSFPPGQDAKKLSMLAPRVMDSSWLRRKA